MLSVDYQRILQAVADRVRLGQWPLTCQEMAAVWSSTTQTRSAGGAAPPAVYGRPLRLRVTGAHDWDFWWD